MNPLSRTELQRLFRWFQYLLVYHTNELKQNPIEDLGTGAQRYAELIKQAPVAEGERFAVYSNNDALAAGFTEGQAIDHVANLSLCKNTDSLELAIALHHVQKYDKKLEYFASEEELETLKEGIRQAIERGTETFNDYKNRYGIRSNTNNATAFIVCKLQSQKDACALSKSSLINSNWSSFNQDLASISLSELRQLLLQEAASDDQTPNEIPFVVPKSYIQRIHKAINMAKKLSHASLEDFELEFEPSSSLQIILQHPKSKVFIERLRFGAFDNNIDTRARELQTLWSDWNNVFEVDSPSKESLLQLALLSRIKDVHALFDEAESHWALHIITGNTSSSGLLSDMVRVRSRLRYVLGEEKDIFDHITRAYFVRFLSEFKIQLRELHSEPENLNVNKAFFFLIASFRRCYPKHDTKYYKGTKYAKIPISVEGRNIGEVHYEFCYLVKDDQLSCELHFEGTRYTNEAAELDSFIAPLVQDKMIFDEYVFDNTWSKGNGSRIRLIFKDYQDISRIAYTMHDFIERTQLTVLQLLQGDISTSTPQELQEEAALEDSKNITVWETQKQTKGLSISNDFIGLSKEIASLCFEEAKTRDEIAQVLHESNNVDIKTLNGSYIPTMLRVGVLKEKKGLCYLSDFATSLAQQNIDPLRVAMLKRVFLLARMLVWIQELTGTEKVSQEDIRLRTRTYYQHWGSNRQIDIRIGVLRGLGLIEPEYPQKLVGKVIQVTELGRKYIKRLIFPPEEAPKEFMSVKYKTIKDIVEKEYQEKDAIFTETELRSIHLALHASKKRFVLLSGLSGTGKTMLLSSYAKNYLQELGLSLDSNFEMISVTPAFRDPIPLFGYLNTLHSEPTYQYGKITEILLHANENPAEPHFLIFDEMNLARVEFYLAPILSAMESGEGIEFHDHSSGEVNGVPNRLEEWPNNIFIGGTVNMDETTHPFSDKVLDRAFTLEFWDIKKHLEHFLDKHNPDPLVKTIIKGLYDKLSPINAHFGYRTAKAIIDYVEIGLRETEDSSLITSLIDQAVFAKVLPKLKGQRTTELETVLQQTQSFCKEHGLEQCEKKIASMMLQLIQTGLTRFWS